MTFQNASYAAFVVAVGLLSAAAFIIYRNGLTINQTEVWLVLAAMPFMTVGLPAAIIRHSGIWKPNNETGTRRLHRQQTRRRRACGAPSQSRGR